MKHDNPCADLPELKRLNYFFGQMLGVNDFRTEQHYFREKLKLHNRCLHGYGTVCGLVLAPVPGEQECEPDSAHEQAELQAKIAALAAELERARMANDGAAEAAAGAELEQLRRRQQQQPDGGCAQPAPARVVLGCGLALDCEGNEIIVRRPCDFDPWQLLSEDDRKQVRDSGASGTDLYLSICYCEQPVDPVRPVAPSACGPGAECSPGKLRDAFRLRLSAAAPPPDERCETCCSSCDDACLVLAVLRGYRKGQPPKSIDNSIRRVVATAYPATTITGISWTHGATYTGDEAAAILGSPEGGGIQVDFSRPVLASTLTDGVVDIWLIEGGRTRKAGVNHLEGEFDDFGGAETVTSFRFAYQGDENLDPGDRVMITIRCAFILDECCRPVDGAHVGGRVPLIAGYEEFDRSTPAAHCQIKPPGYGPWTSGAGTPGSTFESWFYLEKSSDKRRASKEYPK